MRDRQMLLSRTAEYALRAMAYLAAVPEGSAATSRDVARATAIPEPYAAKVLRRMVAAGLLFGQKGHGGGFQLSRAPDRIRFLDVLEALGERPAEDRCVFGRERCNARKPCPLHFSVTELRDSVHAWAERTTLADLHVEGGLPRTIRAGSAR